MHLVTEGQAGVARYMLGPVDEIDQLPVRQLYEGVEQMYTCSWHAVVVEGVHDGEVSLLQGLQDGRRARPLAGLR